MILENLLSQCNPLVGNPNAQESYTVNLLQVTGYLPKLRGLVFKLIMSNMITYDVRFDYFAFMCDGMLLYLLLIIFWCVQK